jgi:hypothetical protein
MKTSRSKALMHAIALYGSLALSVAASWAHAADSAELGPGNVLSETGEHVYAADPVGFLHAVRLQDGQSTWVTSERALPLAIRQSLLVAMGSVEQFGLGVLLLIDQDSGRIVDRIAFDLPESVSAEISGKPQRVFTTRTQDTTDGLRIHWHYQSRLLRGALLEHTGGSTEEPEIREYAGTLELRLDAAGNYLLPLREASPAPPQSSPELDTAERLPGLSGRQFRSADDRVVLHSTAKADETFGTVYRWELHERASARRLGGLDAHFALTQFMVLGDTLIYLAPAQAMLNPRGELDGAESRLVAYDLRQGRELWHFNVLDRMYRGPMPP